MNKNFFDVFSNKELGSVRTIFETETGEAWFYANDVAKILGYSEKNLSHAIERHTSKEDRKALKYKASSVSDEAKMWGKNDFMDKIFVNESGLYCLIFGSKLPKAKEFKHWVTSEVLPSIRRHGGYIYGQENLAEDEKQKQNYMVKSPKIR